MFPYSGRPCPSMVELKVAEKQLFQALLRTHAEGSALRTRATGAT